MISLIRYATLTLGVLLVTETFSQPDLPRFGEFGLEPGRHTVGFQLLEGQDDSRTVTGGIPSAVHARPIRTYLWYPAVGTNDAQTMNFGRYASLADEDIWPANITGTLRQELPYSRRPLARSLGREGFEALLQRQGTQRPWTGHSR